MKEGTYWLVTSELPQEVFAVWRKPNGALNPVAIVATVDPDGAPRTAPFGSLRAITTKMLRLISSRYHDTYTNLSHDSRVMVALVAPPDMAVSVQGRARIIKERMKTDMRFAIVEIDIEEVKNDMVRSVVIESAITISAHTNGHKKWFQACFAEMEEM
jgi:hypothetical protein